MAGYTEGGVVGEFVGKVKGIGGKAKAMVTGLIERPMGQIILAGFVIFVIVAIVRRFM